MVKDNTLMSGKKVPKIIDERTRKVDSRQKSRESDLWFNGENFASVFVIGTELPIADSSCCT